MDEDHINSTESQIKPPSLLDALIPIIFLVILLALAVILYGADGIGGARTHGRCDPSTS